MLFFSCIITTAVYTDHIFVHSRFILQLYVASIFLHIILPHASTPLHFFSEADCISLPYTCAINQLLITWLNQSRFAFLQKVRYENCSDSPVVLLDIRGLLKPNPAYIEQRQGIHHEQVSALTPFILSSRGKLESPINRNLHLSEKLAKSAQKGPQSNLWLEPRSCLL